MDVRLLSLYALLLSAVLNVMSGINILPAVVVEDAAQDR
jgi:hypothetical protein